MRQGPAILPVPERNTGLATIQVAGPVPPGTRSAHHRMVLASRLLGDVGAIVIGLAVANGLQASLTTLSGGIVEPLGQVGAFTALIVAAWLWLFAAHGLYDRRHLVNAWDEFKLIVRSVTMGTVVAVFGASLLQIPTHRSWMLTTWAGCTLTVLVTRWGNRRLLGHLRRSGVLVSRVLIVGAGREGRDLWRALERSRGLGFSVVGFLDEADPPAPAPGLPPVVGTPAEIRRHVLEQDASAVLIAGGSVATATAERVYRELEGLHVDLHLSTGLLGVAANRVAVQRFDGIPVLAVRRVELSRAQQLAKRAFDIAGASLALVALSPLIAVCALAVRLSGPGPVLFRQERVGLGGRTFTMHKLRSMVPGAEQRLGELAASNTADGPMFKCPSDPRVTRVGRLLRTWSLDELPQLLDVLRGDMSLVGPRPPLPDEVATYDGWTRNRLRVKPGMTGLWQVSGRHTLSFDDYVRYDLFYVKNWSLGMDLFLILRTIPAVLARSGA